MTDSKVTLKDIYDAVNSLREDMAKTYVTKDAFLPVQWIAYGLMGIVGTTVLGAILMLTMKGH